MYNFVEISNAKRKLDTKDFGRGLTQKLKEYTPFFYMYLYNKYIF